MEEASTSLQGSQKGCLPLGPRDFLPDLHASFYPLAGPYPVGLCSVRLRSLATGEQLVLIWIPEVTAFLVVCGQRAGMH